MLSLPPTVRVFVAVEPIDMRGSFDSLAGAVRRLGLDHVEPHAAPRNARALSARSGLRRPRDPTRAKTEPGDATRRKVDAPSAGPIRLARGSRGVDFSTVFQFGGWASQYEMCRVLRERVRTVGCHSSALSSSVMRG